MENWIEKELIDKKTGFFWQWNSEERLDIYQSGLGWPIVTSIINGFGRPADWIQKPGLSKVETLFEIINEISENFEIFYIKNQDEAISQVDWIRDYDKLVPGILEEFTINPSDQNGSAFMGICVGNRKDIILFTYAPGEFIRISLFGNLKNLVPDKLNS